MPSSPTSRRTFNEVVVDERGRIAERLRDGSPGALAPITRVREHGALRLGRLPRPT